MIIKVKTSKSGVPRRNGEGDFWRIFADVSKLQYGKQPIPTYPPPPREDDDEVNCYHWVSTDVEIAEVETLGLFLSFYEDGYPTEVSTNHECYLMNDNGRTIEQLF